MGGCSDDRVYRYDDRAKITEAFKAACEDARFESGSGGYTGTIAEMHGIQRWEHKNCLSLTEAQRYLHDTHNKFDNALAVSFCIAKDKTEADKKREEKANVKWRAAEQKLRDASAKVRAEFGAAKSKTVGCKGCGSKMSRTHLATFLRGRALNCPLCTGDLLSVTARARLTKLSEAVHKARHAAENAGQPKPSAKIGWVVGGMCSS